jgi:hypothetical protein
MFPLAFAAALITTPTAAAIRTWMVELASIWATSSPDPERKCVSTLSATTVSVALSAALGFPGHEMDSVGVAPRDHDEALRETDTASDSLE